MTTTTWAEKQAEHEAELAALNDKQRTELEDLDEQKVRTRQRFEDEHRRMVASYAFELRRRLVVLLAWFATNASRLVAAYVAEATRAHMLALYDFLRAASERSVRDTGRPGNVLRLLTFEFCKLEIAQDASTLAAFAEVPEPGSAEVRTPRRDRSRRSNFHGRVVEAEGQLRKLVAQPFDVVAFQGALSELESAVHVVAMKYRGEVTEHMRRAWAAMLTDDDAELDRIDAEVWEANKAKVRQSFTATSRAQRLQHLRSRLRDGFTLDTRELHELESGGA